MHAQSLPLIWEGDGTSSLCVNAETCDLREVRRGSEVEYMHVVKDVMSVEPAKQEEPRVGQQRSVITSWRRCLTEGRARLILQRYCSGIREPPT